MHPPDLLFYPEFEAFGGEERAILAFCRHLHREGIPHRLVCYYDHIDLASYADFPLVIEQLRPRRHPLLKAFALRRLLLENGGAHLIGLQAALHAGLACPAGYTLRIPDTPSFLSPPPQKTGVVKWFQVLRKAVSDRVTRVGFQKARTVITSSRFLAAEIREEYGVHSVVLPIGIRTDGLCGAPRTIDPVEPLRFLSICRLEANKRIEWMIKALAALRQRDDLPECVLDIVGKGSLRESLESRVRLLGLADCVRFHGFMPDAEIETLMERAHLFLIPARQGYGIPALEALARGLPLVLHEESGVSEILGGSPWVEITPGGAEEFSAGLERMVRRILAETLNPRSKPHIPTECEWAGELGARIGFVCEIEEAVALS